MNKLKNKLYPRLEKYSALLAKAIDDIATDMRIPHQINFTASMLQIFFTKTPVIDARTARLSDVKKFNKLFKGLLKNNIFVAPSQFEVVLLSAAHTNSDLNKAVSAYDSALKAVKN